MDLVVQFIVAVFATLAFCGFTGALGWIIYSVFMKFDMGIVFSSFIATLCLTIFARIFAVIRETPVTVYLLTGIFPIVPGSAIFYTAYYLFISDSAMSSQKAMETFEYAGAIVLGILFGFGIPQSLFNKLKPSR